MVHDASRAPQEISALVTGTSSGLGASLLRTFSGTAFSRPHAEEELVRLRGQHFRLIVHCAVDARKELPAADLVAYVNSNLTLTERLLEIPHDCFVYVSSHAVYPVDGVAHREDEDLSVTPQISIYGVFKLISEQLVLRRSPWPLILRCSSLVGETGRPNNVMKLLRKQDGPLFLSGDCPCNLIDYEQVAEFLRLAEQSTISGIFNLGATDWRTLSEIAHHVGVSAKFGDYLYVPPTADLRKVNATCSIFGKSTLEMAEIVSRRLEDSPSLFRAQ